MVCAEYNVGQPIRKIWWITIILIELRGYSGRFGKIEYLTMAVKTRVKSHPRKPDQRGATAECLRMRVPVDADGDGDKTKVETARRRQRRQRAVTSKVPCRRVTVQQRCV